MGPELVSKECAHTQESSIIMVYSGIKNNSSIMGGNGKC
jgi:hypothetical protein